MGKAEFEALAALIDVQRGKYQDPEDLLDNLARDMAQYLAGRNPRFDQPLFLEAAGVK